MSDFNTISKKQAGMSMVEMAMVMGLIGAAALGVATFSGNMTDVSKKSEGMLARGQLAAALNGYLYSPLGCEDLKLSNPPFGSSATSAAPMKLTKFNYQGLTVMEGGYNADGSKKTPLKYIDLEVFQGYLDGLANAPKVIANNGAGGTEDLLKTILNIRASIKIGNQSFMHFFNVPVLVRSTGEVRFCADEKSVAETCAALKGVYNATTHNCDLASACLLRDTYSVLNCSGGTCDNRFGPAKTNKYTGGFSCPAGSTATKTSTVSWVTDQACGKKCTSTINNTMDWYACMACPP